MNSFLIILLPESRSLVRYSPDAVDGYELRFQIRIYHHNPPLYTDDLISTGCRYVARSPPVNVLYPYSAQIILRIVDETQQKGVTGPHSYPLPKLLILLSYSPGTILQVRIGDPPLIAAHLAANPHIQSIKGPGFCHISASRAVGQEMGSWHCSSLAHTVALSSIYSSQAICEYDLSKSITLHQRSRLSAMMPAAASSAPISSFKRPARICWA